MNTCNDMDKVVIKSINVLKHYFLPLMTMQVIRHDPIKIKYQNKNQFRMEYNLYF